MLLQLHKTMGENESTSWLFFCRLSAELQNGEKQSPEF